MVYFVLEEVKRICGIAQEDGSFDEMLQEELGPKADRFTDNVMARATTSTPPAGSEAITVTQTAISNIRTAQLYALEAHDDDLFRKTTTILESEIAAYQTFLASLLSGRALLKTTGNIDKLG